MSKQKVDIGLDISTSCTGVSVLDTQGRLISLRFISLNKIKSFWDKTRSTRAALDALGDEFDVQNVYVEENLQKFRPGFSSAKTIVTLARMNGITSYQASEVFGVDPIDINVNQARKCHGIVIDKKDKTLSTKEKVRLQVDEIICEQMQDIDLEWPTKVLKSGPRKGQTVLMDESGDMADAWVVCRAGQMMYS